MSSWTALTRTIPPADTILSVAQAKNHLRVFHSDDDAYIGGLIDAATAFIEGPNGAGIALLTQTWRQSFSGVPGACEGVTLPLGPIQAIASVEYVDEDGETVTLDPSGYSFDPDHVPGRLYPPYRGSWPTIRRAPGALKVNYRCGYGDDPEDVPADLRHAALLLIGHLYENREAASEANLRDIPMGVESILARYRVSFFG